MSILAQVTSNRRGAPRATIIFGVGGCGKSTFAAGAPSPIFLPCEAGINDIEVPAVPFLDSYPAVMEAITALYQEEHQYQTVVVDSLDWLERLIWDDVASAEKVDSIEGIGYGKGYTFALDRWRTLLSGLNALRKDRGMHAVCLAHSQIEKFEDPGSASYDRYSIKLHKKAAGLVVEWADEVLFARSKVVVKVEDEGFNKKRGRGIGGDDRVLCTTERPSHYAKNRLGMPQEIPLTLEGGWNEYAQYFTTTREES